MYESCYTFISSTLFRYTWADHMCTDLPHGWETSKKGGWHKTFNKKKKKKNQNLTELYINCRLTTNNDSKTPNKRGFSCSATCQDEVTHAVAEFKPENASARHSHTPRLMVGRTSQRTNSEQTQGTMTCLGSVQLGYFFIVT